MLQMWGPMSHKKLPQKPGQKGQAKMTTWVSLPLPESLPAPIFVPGGKSTISTILLPLLCRPQMLPQPTSSISNQISLWNASPQTSLHPPLSIVSNQYLTLQTLHNLPGPQQNKSKVKRARKPPNPITKATAHPRPQKALNIAHSNGNRASKNTWVNIEQKFINSGYDVVALAETKWRQGSRLGNLLGYSCFHKEKPIGTKKGGGRSNL